MGPPLTDSNRLSIKHPEISIEWDVIGNGGVEPSCVASGSMFYALWKCSKCDYSWHATVYNRTTRKSGCPACSGYAVSDSNRLSMDPQYAHVVSEWHPTLNGAVTANDVTKASGKRIVWLCKQCAHVWSANIVNRTSKGSGCPACSGNVVSSKNRLSTLYPEVAASWAPRNLPLTANDVSYASGRNAWWICSVCEYEWEACIRDRISNKTGCQQCRNRHHGQNALLSISYPNVAAEWHPTLNTDIDLSTTTFGSSKKAWWKCSACSHVWHMTIAARTGTTMRKCPECTIRTHLHGTSMIEIAIAAEFVYIFSFTQMTIDSCRGNKIAGSSVLAEIDSKYRTRFATRGLLPDIVIPGLFDRPSTKLIIEWDSAEFHGGKRANVDIAKTKALCRLGHNVVRMRESPLPAITPLCVCVGVTPRTSRPKIKTAIDAVLRHILTRYTSTASRNRLNLSTKRAIDAYLSKATAQNQDAASEYMIGLC